MKKHRCGWCIGDPLYEKYHDEEWGVPVKDDETLFEFLMLETFQAGLSWITVLRKRENFRIAFDNFDFNTISNYSEEKLENLIQDTGTNGNPIIIELTHYQQAPANTPLSDQIRKDLKKRGFKFVGTTVIYAHMQATGMVNDHEVGCFRYKEVLIGK